MFKRIKGSLYACSVFASLLAGVVSADYFVARNYERGNGIELSERVLNSPKFLESLEAVISQEQMHQSEIIKNPSAELKPLWVEELDAKDLFEKNILPRLNSYLGMHDVKVLPEIKTGLVIYTPFLIPSILSLLGIWLIIYIGRGKKDSFTKRCSNMLLPFALFSTASLSTVNFQTSTVSIPPGVYLNNTIMYNASAFASDRYSLSVIIGHEYIHHLQDVCKIGDVDSVHLEGMARFIECELAKKISVETEIAEYSDVSVSNELSELASIYVEACKKQNKQPSWQIEMIADQPGETTVSTLFFDATLINPYPVGNVLFRMYERDTGKKVSDIFRTGWKDFDEYLDKEFWR